MLLLPLTQQLRRLSNPEAVNWWLYTYIGQAVNETLFDGVYFDCCCGAPPGDAFADRAAVAKFRVDAQAAFDRALALISAAGKWASAWNSEPMRDGGNIVRGNCKAVMTKWMAIGANPNLALQPVANAFKNTSNCRGCSCQVPTTKEPCHSCCTAPSHSAAGAAPPPAKCSMDSCSFAKGMDSVNSGIVAPPIATENETECCSRCKANSKCEAFEMGVGGCASGPPACNNSAVHCFLVGHFRGLRPNKDRTTGCVRSSAPPPPPPPAPADGPADRNATVAAFLIARGKSAMLMLPVEGAYENMADYDLHSPLLRADFGTPLGAGKERAPGVFSREFTGATISLDCGSWTTSFKMK